MRLKEEVLFLAILLQFFLQLHGQTPHCYEGARVSPSDSCEHGIVQLCYRGQWVEACGGDDWKFSTEILHHELEISPGLNSFCGCGNSSVRLVNTSRGREGGGGRGRGVEICIGSLWRPACREQWGERESGLVCSELGLGEYGHVAGHRTALGGISPTINCTQSDETLEMCVTEKQCNSSMFPEIECHEFPQTTNGASTPGTTMDSSMHTSSTISLTPDTTMEKTSPMKGSDSPPNTTTISEISLFDSTTVEASSQEIIMEESDSPFTMEPDITMKESDLPPNTTKSSSDTSAEDTTTDSQGSLSTSTTEAATRGRGAIPETAISVTITVLVSVMVTVVAIMLAIIIALKRKMKQLSQNNNHTAEQNADTTSSGVYGNSIEGENGIYCLLKAEEATLEEGEGLDIHNPSYETSEACAKEYEIALKSDLSSSFMDSVKFDDEIYSTIN